MLAPIVLVSLLNHVPAAKFECPVDSERKVERRSDAILVYCEGPDLLGGVAKNGPYRELRPDRSLRWAGSYINDRPDGAWLRFDRNRNLLERRVYRNGRLLSKTLESGATTQGDGAGGEPSGFEGEDLSGFEGPEDEALSEYEGPDDEEFDEGSGVGPQSNVRRLPGQGRLRTQPALSDRDFATQHYGFTNSVGPNVKGDSVFGVGGNLLYFLPMLDIRYRYGVADPLAYDFRLSTFGLYNRLDTGLRTRVIGDETVSLFLDTKFGLNAIFLPGDLLLNTSGFDLAGVPGLGLSFGGPRFQLSLGAQVPIVFFTFVTSGVSGDFSLTGASPMLRPFIAVDAATGEKTSVYLQVEIETSLQAAFESNAIAGATTLLFTSIGVAFDLNRRKGIF